MPAGSSPSLYLHLIGRLQPDNRLEFRPGYLDTRPGRWPQVLESPLIAELSDREEHLLLRYPILAAPYSSPSESGSLSVRAAIPFPPETRLIRFLNQEALVAEINVSKSKPQVRLTWKPKSTERGVGTVAWESSHGEGLPVQFFLRYSHNGKHWQRTGDRTYESRQKVDFDQLPGGKRCRIEITATDGVNTTRVRSPAFQVRVKPCRAILLSPADGAAFSAQETVPLRGQGYFLEEETVEQENLAWSSSLDGRLGTGPNVIVALSPGRHVITLAAGKGKRIGKSSVTISMGKD